MNVTMSKLCVIVGGALCFGVIMLLPDVSATGKRFDTLTAPDVTVRAHVQVAIDVNWWNQGTTVNLFNESGGLETETKRTLAAKFSKRTHAKIKVISDFRAKKKDDASKEVPFFISMRKGGDSIVIDNEYESNVLEFAKGEEIKFVFCIDVTQNYEFGEYSATVKMELVPNE